MNSSREDGFVSSFPKEAPRTHQDDIQLGIGQRRLYSFYQPKNRMLSFLPSKVSFYLPAWRSVTLPSQLFVVGKNI